MKKFSFLVIMVTIWVALLVAPVAAQNGYVTTPRGIEVAVTPDSTPGVEVGQVGNVSDDEANNADESDNFDEFEPAGQVVAAQPGPRGPQGPEGQPGLRGKSGLRGQHGLRGIQGRQGLRGPAGKNANARGAYHEIKSWNPASCSRVDAKANQAFERSKAYTDGALSVNKKSVSVAPATKASDKDQIDWNWWWLLWPLLFLLFLGFLIWLGQLGAWNWFTNLFQPKPAPARPIMTNIAGCNAFGIDQDDAEIEIVSSGKSCVEIRKGVSFSPNGGWKWAQPNEKLTISSDVGTPAKFIVACHNRASMPIKTDLVFPKDTFVSHLNPAYRVTRGSFYLGTEKLGEMTREDIEAITNGDPFPLSNYIDEIPADAYFSFVYEVEITGDGNNVPTPSGQAPSASRYSVKEIMAERERKAAEAAKKLADEAKAKEDKKAADKAAEEVKKAKENPPVADDNPSKKDKKKKKDQNVDPNTVAAPNFEAVAQDAANVAADNK